jgi:uncharacterized Fe-S cluster protein YjdI
MIDTASVVSGRCALIVYHTVVLCDHQQQCIEIHDSTVVVPRAAYIISRC